MIKNIISIFTLLREHPRMVFFGFLGIALSNLVNLSFPIILGKGLDSVSDGGYSTQPWLYLGSLLALLSFAGKWIWRHHLLGMGRQIEHHLRVQLMQRALSLPEKERNSETSGKFIALVSNDLMGIKEAVSWIIVAAFDAIIFSLLAIYLSYQIHPMITLKMILPFPFLGLALIIITPIIYKLWNETKNQFEDFTQLCRGTIQQIHLWKRSGDQEKLAEKFNQLNHTYLKTSEQLIWTDSLWDPLTRLISTLAFIILFWLGVSALASPQNDLSVGEILTLSGYLAQLAWPMMALGWMNSLIQSGAASYKRYLELGAIPSEPPFSSPEIKLESKQNCWIQLKQLNLYIDSQPLLKGISLELHPGETLALLGPVGSGKSLLAEVLCGILPWNEGEVYLGENQLPNSNFGALREYVALVHQEPFLFSDTICNNLRLVKPSATQEELEAICKTVCLHQEILSFPDGYQQMLGEFGVSLSGGQRQRLCLARALLQNKPIIIFDDTLSALDQRTEASIIDALSEISNEICQIRITHRLQASKGVDTILILQEGEISGRGRHQELFENHPWYRQTYLKQREHCL